MMRVISVLAALALSASASESATEKGIAAFRNGRYVEAKQLLGEAVARDSHDEHARTFLALTNAASGHCAEAIPDLADRFAKSRDADLRRLAGLALVECTESQLQAAYPADADVLYQTARTHMKAFNDATYQMFQKTPASYRVDQLSGEIFETQGKYAEAAAEYRKAIEKNPRALNLHFRLGRAILLESHDPDALARAQKEFEAELALNAEDAAAEFQVGQILVTQGKPADGLKRYERALELRPDFVEAALAVGKARVQAKQYAQAIPLLEHAVGLQPTNEAAHYNLMLAYRNSGQMDKARHEQQELNKLQRPPEGEFTDFLKRLGEKPAAKP